MSNPLLLLILNGGYLKAKDAPFFNKFTYGQEILFFEFKVFGHLDERCLLGEIV